jgi:hypothetical protein
MGTMDKAKDCRPCEITWGVFGVLAGTVLFAIGLDLLTGGRITQALTRSTNDDDR